MRYRGRYVTPEQYQRFMEEEGEAYASVVDRIDAARRAEWEREFGPALPYRPDSQAIHASACAELDRIHQEAEEMAL